MLRPIICNSQDIEKANIYQSNSGIKTGTNFAWYKNSIGNYNLNNIEFSMGYSFHYLAFNKLDFSIQPLLGIKFKKKYDFRFDQSGKRKASKTVPEPLYVFSEIDKFDKILSYNHYYLELPVVFGYKIFKKTEILAGYSFRYYLPNSKKDNDDFICKSIEDGFQLGLSYGITENINFGGSIYLGTSDVYSRFVNIQTLEGELSYSSTLKSRYVQLSILYNLKTEI